MCKTVANWVQVEDALPRRCHENVLVVVIDKSDPERWWMEWATFDPGEGWAGSYMDYISDPEVTHWAYRPEFPE